MREDLDLREHVTTLVGATLHLTRDGSPHVARVRSLEASLEYCIFVANFSGIESKKEAILAEMQRAIDAPDWLGTGWDELLDSLRDLGWCQADHYVLILEHLDSLIAPPNKDAEQLLDVLRQAIRDQRSNGTSLYVLLTGGVLASIAQSIARGNAVAADLTDALEASMCFHTD